MSRELQTATPNDTAETAWARLRLHRFHHLVVIDRQRVVGVVSAHDLGGEDGGHLRAKKRLRDLMSSPAVTATTGTRVQRAADIFRTQGIGCLPILQRGRLVGIVTVNDLLAVLARLPGSLSDLVERPKVPKVRAQPRPRVT